MLLFCPSCSNVLTVSTTTTTLAGSTEPQMVNCLECQTCPYQYVLQKRFYERKNFKHVDREDIFGGPDEWLNADKTAVQCPVQECTGVEAAFFEVQIRSADEPMTMFYRCMTCGNRWRSN